MLQQIKMSHYYENKLPVNLKDVEDVLLVKGVIMLEML
jgi:hypothetical protein